MASREEQLLAQVARLQARNGELEEENETLRQQVKGKAVQEVDDQEDERPRKKQKTHDENSDDLQLVLGGENRTRRDVACSAHHQLPENQQQVSVNSILMLPRELLGRTLDFLEFSERRDFFIGNHDLWEHVRVEYETQIMCNLILDRSPRLGFLDHDFMSVCRLDFGRHCSDTALAVLCHERAFPQLKHLAMAGSTRVTDKGLSLITENPNRCKNLVLLDITGCNGTSLEGTFLLRDLLINLRILRRQPKWMDGQVIWKSGRRLVYYADGIHAQYGTNGEMEHCTYIRYLFEVGSSFRVVCKHQVVLHPVFEHERWQSTRRPEWMRHTWRPGSTLLYLPDSQSVMIASAARGIFPVQDFPRPEDAQLIPVNSRRVLNRQGGVCARDDPNAYAVLSHGRLQPLDTPMPPQEVVSLCRTQVERAKVVMAGRQQETDERVVHRIFSGGRNDVPPPSYWFQHD